MLVIASELLAETQNLGPSALDHGRPVPSISKHKQPDEKSRNEDTFETHSHFPT